MALTTVAVCVGDNCVDHYLPPLDRVFVGGNALNVAVALQRARTPAAYVGVVGDDADGRFVLERLHEQNVDVSHVRMAPGQTGRTEIRLTPQGEREFISEHFGPTETLELGAETLEFVRRHRLVHTTWLGRSEAYLPAYRHDSGPLVSLDYGERCGPQFVERTLPFVDLAFFSLPEEHADRAEALAREMAAGGERLVVVTMGRHGSLAFDGCVHAEAAFPVETVDTLGAGDTFVGVFLAGRLAGDPVPDCMRRASQAAAQTCTHYGAWPQDG